MTLKVLLVEDDAALRHTLAEALEVEGHSVARAASLADARVQLRWALQRQSIDLVLLDLGMPDGDGRALLQELRAQAHLPVIVISARGMEAEKVALLDEGADDFLVKPFGIGELLARMRVALRHRGRHLVPAHTHYAHLGLEVDVAQRRVLLHGQAVHLTPTEFALLAELVRSGGRVMTHRQLLVAVWGPEHSESVHYLRLYMAQLRAKLEDEPSEPVRLLTELGVGYRLAIDA